MISVVIPTYKNKEILLQNLAHNLPFLKDCQVVVINDDPTTSLKQDLQRFQNIVLLENKQNLGFAESINLGVKKAHGTYVMLLNNDVRLQDNSFKKAVKYFQADGRLFAVSFAQKEKDGTLVGKNRTYWRQGMFMHEKAADLSFGNTAWAEGGSCLIDHDKFLELGGFDTIYAPFYWEDVDLSYRAKKAGYKIIFDPTIVVIHHHESTIGKYYEKDFIQRVAFRNQLLFIWKNINDPRQKITHFLFLPYHLVNYALAGKKDFLLGFIEALRKIL